MSFVNGGDGRRPDRGANQLLGDEERHPTAQTRRRPPWRRALDHQTAGQVRTLHTHSVVAAPHHRPRLVVGGRDRRPDAVGLVVPEAMAYAGIAGLPPQAGLYTLLVVALLV